MPTRKSIRDSIEAAGGRRKAAVVRRRKTRKGRDLLTERASASCCGVRGDVETTPGVQSR
jgi:hypothetical protein